MVVFFKWLRFIFIKLSENRGYIRQKPVSIRDSLSTVGINDVPLLANLFLYSYEADCTQGLIKNGKCHLAKSFNFTLRYTDDVISLNNPFKCK